MTKRIMSEVIPQQPQLQQQQQTQQFPQQQTPTPFLPTPQQQQPPLPPPQQFQMFPQQQQQQQQMGKGNAQQGMPQYTYNTAYTGLMQVPQMMQYPQAYPQSGQMGMGMRMGMNVGMGMGINQNMMPNYMTQQGFYSPQPGQYLTPQQQGQPFGVISSYYGAQGQPMNPIGTMNPMNMLSTSQFPQQQTTTTTTTIPMPANTAIYPPPPPPQQQQQQQPPPPPPPLPVQVQVTGQTQQPPPPQLATTATTIFQPPPYVNQRCSRGTIIAGHEKNKEESDEDNDGIELKIERDEDLDNDTALKKAELNKKISDLEALCEQKTKEKEEKTKAARIVYKRASEAITECKVVQQEYTDFIRKCEMEKCYYAASLNALALMGYNVSELRATEKASLNGQKRRASDRDVKVAECGLRPLAKKPAIEGGGSVVKINVGGQVFTLSRENLSKFKGTLLYEQFSGDYDALTDSSGILFIDRNGDVFKHVAEYIRSGTCECTRSINKASEYDLAQLCAEAEFFGLDQLVYEIRGADLPTSMKVPFKCRKLLTEWCQAASFTLLYQASKHKFSSTDFHRLCNGKSPTLVIVRSGDCIFGGYTEVPWKTTQDPELAEGSGAEFLFSLVNKSGSDPIKFPLKNKSQKKCILQCGRYGPSFGADVKGMCELHIANNANINSHSHTMGFPSMFSGRDCDKTIFAGSERFQVMEYEVFLVKRRGNGT